MMGLIIVIVVVVILTGKDHAVIILILKTLGSTKSITKPKKGRVGIDKNGGNKINDDATSSILRTSSSIDISISVIWTAVKYDEIDGGDGKLIKKLPKSRKIIKKSKKPQSPKKFAKTIGLEERLLKHQSSISL